MPGPVEVHGQIIHDSAHGSSANEPDNYPEEQFLYQRLGEYTTRWLDGYEID